MSVKPLKTHTPLAHRLASDFDRVGFQFIALVRETFDEPTSQVILTRLRFCLLDAVTAAEANTTPTVGADLFGPTKRRTRKGVRHG